MDFSSIDWASFVKGLVTGLGAWAMWTVLASGRTVIEPDHFDVFDDDEPVPYVVSGGTGWRKTTRGW